MSKRLGIETQMKQRDVAIRTLNNAGYSYVEVGAHGLRITSGPMAQAVIDLSSGKVTGDTDYDHTDAKLGSLRQAYAVEAHKEAISQTGGYIESNTVDEKGRIVLIYNVG